MDSLRTLRIDLARRSNWNIGYLVAGLVYWSFAATVGSLLPMQAARVYWMIGGFTIFPMAILFSRLLGSDPFTKGNTIASLIALTHVSLIGMMTPLLIIMFRDYPAALPLTAAIVFGASFPVFFWAFGDPLFLWHIIARASGATIIWFSMPDYRYSVLPGFVALVYLVTAILLPRRRQAWLRANEIQLHRSADDVEMS